MRVKRRGPYRALIALTGLAGVAALAYGISRATPGAALAALTAGFVVEMLPVRLSDELKVSLANVVTFTVMLVAGPAAAVFSGVGSGLATTRSDAGSLRAAKAVFNVGQFAFSALVAGLTFWWLAGGSAGGPLPLGGQQALAGLGALTAAGVVYSAVNSGLVAGIIAALTGSPFLSTVRSFAETLPLEFLYLGLAALLAVLLQEVGVVALGLLAVPALIARRALLAFQEKAAAYERLVNSFVKVLEVKDGYTSGHAERVAQLSEAIATEFGIDAQDRRGLRYGALLHDIGKVNVPASIICKDGPLSDEEFDVIQDHPELGTEILAEVQFLEPALEVVRHHHERWDGHGYPDELAGTDIPLPARIVTAVDAFDAMTSTRSYRRAMSIGAALEEMRLHAGRQFDPDVVAALEQVTDELGWTATDEPVRTIPGDGTLDGEIEIGPSR